MPRHLKYIPTHVTKTSIITLPKNEQEAERLSSIDYDQPQITEGNALISSIKQLIHANAASLLKELLLKDFILGLVHASGKNVTTRTKGDVTIQINYSFQPCFVTSNIEWLIDQKAAFTDIIKLVTYHDNRYKTNFLSVIADCRKTAESRPTILEPDNIWFDDDFLNPPTVKVKKPSDRAQREEFFQKLQKIKEYVKEYISPTDPKYIKGMAMCETYAPILLTNKNLTIDRRHQIYEDLTSKETTAIFAKHRDLKYLLKEAIAFLLFNILYPIFAFNRCHQHFGIFTCPKSEKLLHEATASLGKMI